jgi:TPR repeat protein
VWLWLVLGLCAVGCAKSAKRGSEPAGHTPGVSMDAEKLADDGLRLGRAGRESEALASYRGACAGGSARGCDFLGGRLRDGRGVDRDLRGALAAFDAGCRSGSGSACQSLGAMYAIGGSEDGSEDARTLPIDLARSFQAHERACRLGWPDGCLSVGYMFEHGEHVAADLPKAIELYRRACDTGSGDACYALALLYTDGRGVPRDDVRALQLLETGCRGNGGFACAALAKRSYDRKHDTCCTLGLLLRGCKLGHRQSCMRAGIVCGAEPEQVEAEFKVQCSKAGFEECALVKEWR